MDLDDDEIPELDLIEISHVCYALMRDLTEILWSNFINQDPLTHWVLCLACDAFFNIFLVELLIFYLKYYELFFIVTVEGVPSQQLKRFISLRHDIIVNTHCYETIGIGDVV